MSCQSLAQHEIQKQETVAHSQASNLQCTFPVVPGTLADLKGSCCFDCWPGFAKQQLPDTSLLCMALPRHATLQYGFSCLLRTATPAGTGTLAGTYMLGYLLYAGLCWASRSNTCNGPILPLAVRAHLFAHMRIWSRGSLQEQRPAGDGCHTSPSRLPG